MNQVNGFHPHLYSLRVNFCFYFFGGSNELILGLASDVRARNVRFKCKTFLKPTASCTRPLF